MSDIDNTFDPNEEPEYTTNETNEFSQSNNNDNPFGEEEAHSHKNQNQNHQQQNPQSGSTQRYELPQHLRPTQENPQQAFSPEPSSRPKSTVSEGPNSHENENMPEPFVGLHDEDEVSIPVEEDEPDSRTLFKAHEVRYYRFLFNVTTKQVLLRCLYSALPYPPKLLQEIGERPDLWGPFWIPTTLIFAIQAMGNITRWFEDQKWSYDFTKLGAATATVYIYLIFAVLVMYGSLRYFQTNITALQVIAVYGYSFFVYILASLLSAIPFSFVRWISIAIAALLSSSSIFTNFFFAIQERPPQLPYWLAAMAFIHLGFAFACEFYFFEY